MCDPWKHYDKWRTEPPDIWYDEDDEPCPNEDEPLEYGDEEDI